MESNPSLLDQIGLFLERYESEDIDLEGLRSGVEVIASALDNSVPAAVHRALKNLVNELELAQFTVSSSGQRARALELISFARSEINHAMARHARSRRGAEGER